MKALASGLSRSADEQDSDPDARLRPSEQWLPSWMPEETLFALCSRYHRIQGGRHSSETCLDLFGTPRHGLSHDMPERLAFLVERTSGRLGSAMDILSQHTVLGYYLRFRSVQEHSRLLSMLLAEDGVGIVKAKLGLMASKCGALHPLRLCPVCVQQDLDQGELPVWRIGHQLPGVWMCATHSAKLMLALARLRGNERLRWVLPDEVLESGRCIDPLPLLSTDSCEIATSLARDSNAVLERDSDRPFAKDELACIFEVEMRAKGLLTLSGRLRQTVSDDFSEWSERFQGLPESSALVLSKGAAEAVIWSALCRTGSPLHPLRYIMLSQWLCGSWDRMVSAVGRPIFASSDAIALPIRSTQIDPSKRQHASPARTEFEHLVVVDGMAPTAASNKVGVSVHTGLQWAISAGIAVRSCPIKINAAMRSDIAAQLMLGLPKPEIAANFGISLTSVTRVLLSTPGLSTKRSQSLRDAKRFETRLELTRARHAVDSGGVNAIRAVAPRALAYARKHDQEWLRMLIEEISPRIRIATRQIDWQKRDRRFAASIAALRARSTERSS